LKDQNIDDLCEKRKALIYALEQGQLDKELFIQENFKMIRDIKRVDMNVESLDEGIVKYHYFNTRAKMKMMDADTLEFRDPRASEKLKQEAYSYYTKKEQITLQLLEFLKYHNITAYFINLNSRYLRGNVFEIVLGDTEYGILHSKDRKILHKLKTAGCFVETQKDSLIHTYVNTKV